MSQVYDHLFKILLIGDSGVGKSSILSRYADDTFSFDSHTTIGVDFKIKTVIHENKCIKLQIWDTAGQERFRTITTSYYRGSHAIIIAFDLTNYESFNNVKTWISEIDKHISNKIFMVLVGTKSDLVSKIGVTKEMIDNLCQVYNLEYIETSAKKSININALFTHICDNLLVTPNNVTDKQMPKVKPSRPSKNIMNKKCEC